MATYDNPWLWKGKPFDTKDIGIYQGFVYCIVNTQNNMKYIGRKYFYEIRKVKGKSRRQRKESNWKDYYGSSDLLLTDIKNSDKIYFKRYIMSLHKTRGDVNYEEVKQQFINNVLEEGLWYNENINGKWKRKPSHIVEARQYDDEFFKLFR